MVFLPNQVLSFSLLSPHALSPSCCCCPPSEWNGGGGGEENVHCTECQATFGPWQTKLALSGGVFGSVTVPKITLSNFLDMYVTLITLIAS